jgi:hypothetical protein
MPGSLYLDIKKTIDTAKTRLETDDRLPITI